jgi:hypothetical protein
MCPTFYCRKFPQSIMAAYLHASAEQIQLIIRVEAAASIEPLSNMTLQKAFQTDVQIFARAHASKHVCKPKKLRVERHPTGGANK